MVYDYDENGTSLGTTTRIVARATDMAGAVSLAPGAAPDSSAVITFKVKPGFRPRTLLYSRKILALGDNHYEDGVMIITKKLFPLALVEADSVMQPLCSEIPMEYFLPFTAKT